MSRLHDFRLTLYGLRGANNNVVVMIVLSLPLNFVLLERMYRMHLDFCRATFFELAVH